jgi:exopolyphosphatase/guanosine-5'-triphosphate,3'-diphosphate pyrophosphatase
VIQGSSLTRADIAEQVKEYSARTVAQRRELPGLQPKRADVILAGACILQDIIDRLGVDQLTISDRGLRHGLAFDLFSKE